MSMAKIALLTSIVAVLVPLSATAAPLAGSVAVKSGTWAHPDFKAAIRKSPSSTAQRVASTHYLTEDKFPEVYPVLRSFVDDNGGLWYQIGVPVRPNGLTGWVREAALGPLSRAHTRLLVDRKRLRATLYRNGTRIWHSRIGVGKRNTPTPAGQFWIREKFKVADPGGSYGPRAFGTSNYSRLSDWPGGGVIGIHGTNEPGLIPGRPSHGCIRVPNSAVLRLYKLMPVGTPVEIR
ncbi:MAG: L,D-transpeptidase [Thermoleophilia bacterium]|nr:L,D-transpeptidase [Thermoleophilia bacterium]